MAYDYDICLWYMTMIYDYNIWLWHMTITYNYNLWLWYLTVTYDCDIRTWRMTVINDCDIWMWRKSVTHDYSIWLWHMTMTNYYDISLWHTTRTYYYDIWLWNMTKTYDSIQRRAIRLIGNETLTASLPPLQLRRDIGDLALFYRYFNGRCSDEIAGIISKLAVPKRCTRQTSQSHCFTVELKTNRTKRFDCSFVPRTAKLWNSMPQDVFPDSFNLQSFKSRVNKFLSSKSLHYMHSM